MGQHTNTNGAQKQQQVWFYSWQEAAVSDDLANLLTAKG
jgi:hypothetical protein